MNAGRNGGAILFCGAGFSADCLSFDPEVTLGTGGQLLDLMNEKLREKGKPGNFKTLANAADALELEIGEHGMLLLLQNNYRVIDPSQDMVDIVNYPWDAIYTTNYDDAIEQVSSKLPKKINDWNNTDDPKQESTGTPVIHLHGYARKWDIKNFKSSCILGADSYLKLPNVGGWLERFRRDVDRAQFVVFVGFNAADFHINKIIYDISGLREKAFFINRPSANADPDIEADQKRLGTPLYKGRNGFAKDILDISELEQPKEPRLANFSSYEPAVPATTIPAVSDIENFFLFNDKVPEQLARDNLNEVSDFHLYRPVVGEVLNEIENGVNIFLINGYVCDGKSIFLNDLSLKLARTRRVYHLRHSYESFLDEVSSLLKFDPKLVLVIENCFDLHDDKLASLAKLFENEDRVLLLSSRSIATEAESTSLAVLEGITGFRKFNVPRLSDEEADKLVDLVAQFAGWRHFFSGNDRQRRNYIQKECEGSLPHFLLKLLNSEHVRNRYREELSKIPLDTIDKQAVIAALYIAHIGHDAPISFLSNALHTDFGAFLDSLNGKKNNQEFRLIRKRSGMVQTVPSIGATNILKSLFEDRDIVDAVVTVVQNLTENYARGDFEKHMFNQMMRYSILGSVVTSIEEVNRFFDHTSRLPNLRNMPLFWLQWHMAMSDQGNFSDAEKYLEQGFKAAEEYERRSNIVYKRIQLQDRQAKFLMNRAAKINRNSADLFRDFKTACELTTKILNQPTPKHYPFQTLELIAITFSNKGLELADGQREMLQKWIESLISKAKARLNKVPEGYQLSIAENALETAINITNLSRKT